MVGRSVGRKGVGRRTDGSFYFSLEPPLDATTGVSDKLLEVVIRKMEEDALQVLKFMASNGLVANAKKTAMLFLNYKNSTDGETIELNIGNELVKQQRCAKLLGNGITFNEKQKWND